MTPIDELDDFRTALLILHHYALESPTLNQRGICRHLERLINITASLTEEELSVLMEQRDK